MKQKHVYLVALLLATVGLLSSCGSDETQQDEKPGAIQTIDKSTIANYDKFYCPGTWNEGFEKGPDNMLRSDAKWSWWRMKQSEHFFVFWESGFGDNPNAQSVPAELRVDIDDLLKKAEQFYQTNIKQLGMATIGQGKSMLDQYKMQIYLLYQTEWLATGSGYDDMIGALWVNPSTCQPVGATIGHEIGHSFQYQVAADRLQRHEASYNSNGILPVGFRYGFGNNGEGGCTFWEQSAQWQSYQDYPQVIFTDESYWLPTWFKNCHRHLCHEYMRYASYWLPYYYTQKHGTDAHARIWRESKYPEDPIEAYKRIFCNDDLNTLYAELYEYATHCANFDFDAIRKYRASYDANYTTQLYPVADDFYQVAYSSCPGTTGFNLIPLQVPESGSQVSALLEGLEVGSALAANDPGAYVDEDGNVKGSTKTYNKQSNQTENFRYGFVAILKDGTSAYGDMYTGQRGEATYTVSANTKKLYLCVMAAPDTYQRHAWNDTETDDEQWPYKVKLQGTTFK